MKDDRTDHFTFHTPQQIVGIVTALMGWELFASSCTALLLKIITMITMNEIGGRLGD